MRKCGLPVTHFRESAESARESERTFAKAPKGPLAHGALSSSLRKCSGELAGVAKTAALVATFLQKVGPQARSAAGCHAHAGFASQLNYLRIYDP